MKLLLALVAALALAAPAAAQQSVVAKHRAGYPTPLGPTRDTYEAATVELLTKVAIDVRGGLLRKTTGNNCQGFSCDYICFADGRGFDVLSDAEGDARPAWQGPNPIDASRCALVSSPPPPPPPGPTPTPTPPPPSTDTLVQILEEQRRTNEVLVNIVLAQLVARLDKMIEEQAAQRQALVNAIRELQTQVAGGIKVRF